MMPDPREPGWPVPSNEAARLESLDGFKVMGTGTEAEFEHIVGLASHLLDMPVALISLVGEDHQWFKARVGFEAEQTSRDVSFCAHTILGDDIFEVTNATEDARFADNALVTSGPQIRFYAGAPLQTTRGHNLGSLCVIDDKPRSSLSARDREILRRLAALVMDKLELRRLRVAEQIAAKFAESTAEAFLCVDAAGLISFWNPAAERLFGYARAEALGQSLDIIVPERLRGAHGRGMARVAAGAPSKLAGRTIELVAVRRDGTEFPIELLISTWQDDKVTGMGAVIRDISERRRSQERLENLALSDQLTGLSNRFHFSQQLETALSGEGGNVVLLLDLDGFKDVNDTLGHATGDTVLQALSIRLLAQADASWTVSRLGGDEFAILIPDCCNEAEAESAAAAVLSAFADPFKVDDHVFQLGGSIGVALAPRHGPSLDEILANADLALYAAKAGGGRQHCVFSPDLRNRALDKQAIQAELRRAVTNGEFVLHYQPQVSLADRRIVGCEALLRWQHPTRGLLLPASFIAELETHAAAEELGWWILDEACRQMASWRSSGLLIERVGVNLFGAQFRSGQLASRVIDTVARHGLPPSALELEITETIALSQDEEALEPLRLLRDHGIGLAFDDFGTGYASLSTLKRFPLTRLKIDRGFVRDLGSDAYDAAIVEAVVTMARRLDLDVIAEGIETREHEEQLQSMRCQEGQGFLYGRGLSAEDFEELCSAIGEKLAA